MQLRGQCVSPSHSFPFSKRLSSKDPYIPDPGFPGMIGMLPVMETSDLIGRESQVEKSYCRAKRVPP